MYASLSLSVLGSLSLIDFKDRIINPSLALVGISTLVISFVIGRIVTNNMFAKLIGNSQHRSYFSYSLFVIAAERIGAAFYNSDALLRGPHYVFGISIAINISAIILMSYFIDDLTPHYSYLIEKQKEMLKMGLTNKDLKILETPEYTGLPVPLTNYNKKHSDNAGYPRYD